MGGAVSGLVLRGERLCGWLPAAAEHELVQDFHGTASVLAGGVDVAADVEAVLGDVVAGEAARAGGVLCARPAAIDRCEVTSERNPARSGWPMMTTWPPRVMIGKHSTPAAWVSGARARYRGRGENG